MDNIEEKEETTPEQGYTPRPSWQVTMARIGLFLFILLVIYQIIQISGGWQ